MALSYTESSFPARRPTGALPVVSNAEDLLTVPGETPLKTFRTEAFRILRSTAFGTANVLEALSGEVGTAWRAKSGALRRRLGAFSVGNRGEQPALASVAHADNEAEAAPGWSYKGGHRPGKHRAGRRQMTTNRSYTTRERVALEVATEERQIRHLAPPTLPAHYFDRLAPSARAIIDNYIPLPPANAPSTNSYFNSPVRSRYPAIRPTSDKIAA